MDVEWLILADSAQVVGGKLYLLGGGWENLVVSSGFPTQQLLGVATSLRVPWNETNRRHNVDLEVAHEDGSTVVQVGTEVEVGRPPGIPLGADQRAQIAINVILPISTAGRFVVVARIGGEEKMRTWFRAVAPPVAVVRTG